MHRSDPVEHIEDFIRTASAVLLIGMNRVCNRCHQTKNLEKDFYKAKGYRGGHLPRCKECFHAFPSQTPEATLRRTYRTRKRNLQFLWDYYKKHPCVDCGEGDPIVLHSDHVRGEKVQIVSKLVHHTRSLKVIAAELEKCETRCANCHARRTAEQLGWYIDVVR